MMVFEPVLQIYTLAFVWPWLLLATLGSIRKIRIYPQVVRIDHNYDG
jgi:hypothetical protein